MMFHQLTLAATGVFLLAGFIDPASQVFNTTKDNGPAAYALHCASCHGKTLHGGFGPALVGERFRHKWTNAPVGGLDPYIRGRMPPAAPGSLSDAQYAAIEDVITAANSLPPITHDAPHSDQEVSKPVPEDSLDNAEKEKSPKPDSYAESVTLRRMTLAGNTGLVTDSLLRNPPDKDWLSWRRTLDAQGYSPLSQIDRSNVHRLTLAWSRSLTRGTNGIMPLVHDGVMFLNASGKVFALDAATGAALWEFAGDATPSTIVSLSQPRTIALYGDKIYVPTLNGHVVALNVMALT